MGGWNSQDKRGRIHATEDQIPSLDSKRDVIALLPGDEGYDELMGKLMMKTVYVLMTYFKYITVDCLD